ncbi:hypothetical protein HG66A1_24740 [Gimesia chilikensis]|uniref:Uncharacterized protein n=1 Tax=Gimesia chilikensis TaxID=2605989 RepID=A0A517PMT7_9PLAN|nr:hypothetical protein HG66A1_24740 [Gimesia chilikensis]QDT84924.1 hypothetical protein MalM14_25880 [Gimesia chilikensis]
MLRHRMPQRRARFLLPQQEFTGNESEEEKEKKDHNRQL